MQLRLLMASQCVSTALTSFFYILLVLEFLDNVKGPGKLEVLLLVVIDKVRDTRVVAPSEHAAGCVVVGDC